MSMTFVPSNNYSKSVVHSIEHARRRVYVLALILEQDTDTNDIITALIRAASRGIDVNILADASTYSYSSGRINPLFGITDSVKSVRHVTNRLQAHGATVRWLGAHHPFLFAGRTHSKWIVADNTVYCFGGINLHRTFSKDSDFMFKVVDAITADTIVKEHAYIIRADSYDCAYLSKSIEFSYGTVHIDGGLPFDSRIYRRALEIVHQSSHVLLVTQYCPTGRLAKAIAKKPHKVFYNRPTTKDGLTNGLISFGEYVTGIDSLYSREAYIHAKFLIATLTDGTKVAITGSHNFISYGGILGTREIALETSDPKVIANLESYHNEYIA